MAAWASSGSENFTKAWRLSRWSLTLSTLPYFEKMWKIV